MKLKSGIGGAFLLMLLTTSGWAENDLNLGYIFRGGPVPPPNSNTPWVTASFATQGTNVLFTLTGTSNLTGAENISAFYFNFNDSLTLSGLHFSLISTSGMFDAPTINLNQNGHFDVRLTFKTGDNTSRTFGAGDTISYSLYYTGAGAFGENSFSCSSAHRDRAGAYYAAAHIQNITCGGSAWVGATAITTVPVPEPATISLLGLSLIGGFLCAIKRRF